jgi:hypothetical protein
MLSKTFLVVVISLLKILGEVRLSLHTLDLRLAT